jgi:hypothetical protein
LVGENVWATGTFFLAKILENQRKAGTYDVEVPHMSELTLGISGWLWLAWQEGC